MSRPWNELSAIDAAKAIALGELKSVELVADCLERITARDGELQAWVALDPDRALADARELDRTPRRSPLHGVPVGIKDIIDTADYPTTYNSPIWTDHRPRADAACVALLKRAGCVILGKTVTTEFANMPAAQTRNPHDLSRSPGGSSSGSAAAVADLMVPLALGTQTAGSTIRPASYCGVFAIKPTIGTISRVGVKTLAETLDTIGLFARSPGDLEPLLEILSGRPAQKVAADWAPRIGIFQTAFWHLLEPDNAAAILEAIRTLGQNAQLLDADLPGAIDELTDDHTVVMGYDSARALAWEFDSHPDKIHSSVKQRLKAGWDVTRLEYDAVHTKAAEARIALERTFENCDFLVTPSCHGEAPLFGTTGDSKFNRAWTLLGNPCIAIPLGKSTLGLPLGMQIVGPIGSDMALVQWAGWLQRALSGRPR